MPERDCDLLRDLLISEGAETVVEVGLAYASSALAIGEALVTVNAPNPRHVVIDPFQERVWSNVGWNLLRSAGLESITRLMLAPSSIALPQLVTEGLVADAAFVDGSHRFHEVFVDLYFLRKIIRPGGLIVIDDNWAPSVRTAVHYYEQNLGWAEIPTLSPTGLYGPSPRAPQPRQCLAAGHSGFPTRRSSHPSRSSARSNRPHPVLLSGCADRAAASSQMRLFPSRRYWLTARV